MYKKEDKIETSRLKYSKLAEGSQHLAVTETPPTTSINLEQFSVLV